MRKYLMGFLLFFSVNAFSNCSVFIPEKKFYHESGYAINFDFTSLIESKGYSEVFSPEFASSVLTIKGVEIRGRFKKAEASISIDQLTVTESVVCLTQMCSIFDFNKAFRKTYLKLEKSLPFCL